MKMEQNQSHRDGRGRYTEELNRLVVDQLLSSGQSIHRTGAAIDQPMAPRQALPKPKIRRHVRGDGERPSILPPQK